MFVSLKNSLTALSVARLASRARAALVPLRRLLQRRLDDDDDDSDAIQLNADDFSALEERLRVRLPPPTPSVRASATAAASGSGGGGGADAAGQAADDGARRLHHVPQLHLRFFEKESATTTTTAAAAAAAAAATTSATTAAASMSSGRPLLAPHVEVEQRAQAAAAAQRHASVSRRLRAQRQQVAADAERRKRIQMQQRVDAQRKEKKQERAMRANVAELERLLGDKIVDVVLQSGDGVPLVGKPSTVAYTCNGVEATAADETAPAVHADDIGEELFVVLGRLSFLFFFSLTRLAAEFKAKFGQSTFNANAIGVGFPTIVAIEQRAGKAFVLAACDGQQPADATAADAAAGQRRRWHAAALPRGHYRVLACIGNNRCAVRHLGELCVDYTSATAPKALRPRVAGTPLADARLWLDTRSSGTAKPVRVSLPPLDAPTGSK